jgi:NADP-dependent 3-hydroxy acid dehydrogenase YdfG
VIRARRLLPLSPAALGVSALSMPTVSQSVATTSSFGRSETQRKALSARLTKETGRSVTPLWADLSDKADLAKVEGILRDSQAITMLVNNAGIGSSTALLNTEVDKTAMIALNITALTRLTYAAPQAFVARSAGTIINIASVVGISPETMVCMAQPRRMSLRSAFPSSTSLLTKASASRRSCQA